ncbi:hypothetical protein KZ813_16895 [Sphingomonas sp. RHCKR7]|uniref:hypothetical protein n=1 Tax=Sphingomonas folli TaxID=2862497 RepID=UPI001CA5D2FD|nr:hypothetical protein [Sphingomonas folli]MBW6528522.1 hypothetical protein [Sphingomonas folli]
MEDDTALTSAYARALRARLGTRALPIALAQMNAATGSSKEAWSRVVEALKGFPPS